jgi:transcription termination factor Rho
VTDTTESAAPAQASLTDLRMPELQALAGRLGITGISKMRKPQLVEAIREKRRANGQRPRTEQQGGGGPASQPMSAPPLHEQQPPREQQAAREQNQRETTQDQPAQPRRERAQHEPSQQREAAQGNPREGGRQRDDQRGRQARDAAQRDGGQREKPGEESDQKIASLDEIIHFPEPADRAARDEAPRTTRRANRPQGAAEPKADNAGADGADEGDDDRSGRRRRGRDRYRDRKRRQPAREGSGGSEEDVEILEDDVLIPVAGILDVLDNYAFVRTSGYLPGASDVYVSLGQVKKAGLRRGDAVTGAVRQPREGEGQRQKFNALVRLDSVNGAPVDDALARPDFADLTPVHPDERLRLETTTREATGRVVDLLAPIGKGQRGLLLADAKAGTTHTLQLIAGAITQNHPEVHLMVVLVDSRPEEVTDWQRSAAGEVIASTFDHPAADHTTVAELAIERAKRLVELGQDVVILLDSLTTLTRAYNTSGTPSGRMLAGLVDAAAIHPPKRFVGAARNIENGGSLTILASAAVGGSQTDELILTELAATASSELRLLRSLARQQIFPAVDPNASATAHEELLLTPDELAAVRKLRGVLAPLEPKAALELLLARVRQSSSNAELLLTVGRADPGKLV